MSSGLRNEDYVAFLDESGEDGLQVVAGILIPARWLRAAERRWRDFVRDRLGSRSGRAEIKSRRLVTGSGMSLHVQRRVLSSTGASLSAKAAGHRLHRDALEHIAGIAEVRVISVGLPTNRPVGVYRLWFWMAFSALTERADAPRPRLPLTVIDGEDAALRSAHDLVAHRFHRAFRGRQPYVAGGRDWFVGGSVHQESALHPMVQMADLVAGAARHAIAGRYPYGDWYEQHLRGKARSIGREIDASHHALALLRSLTSDDGWDTGWPDAMLASAPRLASA